MAYKSLSNFLLWNNPKNFANTYEELNLERNASLFPHSFSMYNSNSNIYNLVRASLLLEGFLNKKKLDYIINHFSSSQLEYNFSLIHKDLKYFTCDGQRIYLPFFSKEINYYYYDKIFLLKDSSFKNIIDDEKKYYINPFDYYKYLPFISSLTRLINIGDVDECKFLYHIDFETILIIDKYGNLENEFPIFDEKCKKDKEDLLLKLADVLQAYKKDVNSFIESLHTNFLISNDLYKRMLNFESKRKK